MVQNTPLGVPMFIRRMVRETMGSSKTGLPELEWMTIPLPASGWRAFAMHEETGTFGLHDQSTIYPEHAGCDCVDVATALLFSQKDHDRY